MKTWDDWSDSEISKRIGIILNIVRKGKVGNYYARCCPDYCNSWADIGPIIDDNGISLIKVKDGYLAVSQNWDYIDLNGDSDIENYCIGLSDTSCYGHQNPLRASAIVFLMMNGVNPE